MDTQEIIGRVNLLDLVRAAGGQVEEKADGTGHSNCPLHQGDNRRSLSVYRGRDGKQRWRCFTRCQAGGDVVGFMMRWKRLDFRQAMSELEAWAGGAIPVMEPVIEQRTLAPEPQPPAEIWQERAQAFVGWAQDQMWARDDCRGMNYLYARGMRDETISAFMLGWNPTVWHDDPARWGLTGKPVMVPAGVVIPCWRNGLWYVKVRQMAGEVKYLGVRGGTNTLFGVHLIEGDERPLLIVEGEFDAMVGWQEMRDAVDVVAMPGAGQHLSLMDMVLLSTRRRVLACLDDDEAGRAGLAYLQAISAGIEAVAPPGGCHDLNDALLAGVDMQGWMWEG